jgi:serine O-acetyltransferase
MQERLRLNRRVATINQLSDAASYNPLFHLFRENEALPSAEELKEAVEVCRAILFPGYYGNERISRQTIHFHTGVNIDKLHTLFSRQIYTGLCFSGSSYAQCPKDDLLLKAQDLASDFIVSLPDIRRYLTTDVEAAFDNDKAAGSPGEVIFCNPGIRAITNYRIAHQLYKLGIPFIPRMITEMAHTETGIEIHPAAEIGYYFAINHGTGRVVGETAVIGDRVTLTGAGIYYKLTVEDEGANI